MSAPAPTEPTERDVFLDALTEWFSNTPYQPTHHVMLTLKQHESFVDDAPGEASYTLPRIRVSKESDLPRLANRFMNKANQYVLKGKCRSRRLTSIVCAERGALRNHLHLHALIEKPVEVSEDDFARAIRRAWRRQPMAYHTVYVEPFKSCLAANLNYVTKQGFDRAIYWHVSSPEKVA